MFTSSLSVGVRLTNESPTAIGVALNGRVTDANGHALPPYPVVHPTSDCETASAGQIAIKPGQTCTVEQWFEEQPLVGPFWPRWNPALEAIDVTLYDTAGGALLSVHLERY